MKSAIEGFIALAWTDVTSPIKYERQADRILLDKAVTPNAAVVWRDPESQPPWSPEIGTYLFPIDVYYLVQSETPGQLESTVQGKARDFLNQAIAARNRWAGVPEMHSWRLVGSETEHKRADAWRASGWASARIALEVQLDYEK